MEADGRVVGGTREVIVVEGAEVGETEGPKTQLDLQERHRKCLDTCFR